MLFKGLDNLEHNIPLNQFKIQWDGYSASKFQFRVKQFFRENFGKIGEWFEEISLCGELSQLRIDFLCRFKDDKGKTRLVFAESDGNFHIKMNSHFHPTDEDYLSSMERDTCKFLFCEKNNIPLLRIYEDDPLTLEWFNEAFDYPFGPFF